MNTVSHMTANALGIFTPVLTIILYATLPVFGHAGSLDVETAFTTVAILTLVTHPANMVMTLVPRGIAFLAGFDRIQTYLLSSAKEDGRLVSRVTTLPNDAFHRPSTGSAIRLEDVTIRLGREHRSVLENLTFDIQRQWTAVCAGPVGSGKSVLAKTILGEIAVDTGTVEVASKRIGFCAQIPWLPDGAIRDVICAFADTSANEQDRTRYEQAVRLCCLEHDLDALPDGDRTVVGSRGMNLSGGQRQRVVCMARCQCRHKQAIAKQHGRPWRDWSSHTAR